MSADGGLGRVEGRDAVADNEGHENCDCRHCVGVDVLVDPISGDESIVVLGRTLSRRKGRGHFNDWPRKGVQLSLWLPTKDPKPELGRWHAVVSIVGGGGTWCGYGDTPADAVCDALATFQTEQAAVAKNANEIAKLLRAALRGA